MTIAECASHAPVLAALLWRVKSGLTLVHYAISALLCTAATAAGIDPDRVKFKRAVRIIRRRVDDPAA